VLIKPASINEEGINKILELVANPEPLNTSMGHARIGHPGELQVFIPGISVDTVGALARPFLMPLIGDNESYSLTTDWPTRGNTPYIRRHVLIGQSPAESILHRLKPANFLGDYELTQAEEVANDALYDYTGDFGLFLKAVVEVHLLGDDSEDENPQQAFIGTAEFVCIEDESEFHTVSSLLDSGTVSAADLVTIAKFGAMAKLLMSE